MASEGEEDLTNTFFSKYVTGTFLDDHHVVRNVLDIMFIITFQNSKFRSFSIHRYFLFTLVQVFFWLWQIFTWGLEAPLLLTVKEARDVEDNMYSSIRVLFIWTNSDLGS